MRLAVFTPLAPARSGMAHYAAELLPALSRRHAIDVFASRPPAAGAAPDGTAAFGAHDFVWKQNLNPYDLTVYQLGNAPCHDYMWAYLTHYPGLVVLHDRQLHQSRARALLESGREDRYRTELAFDHPDAPPDVVELGIEGLLGDNLVHLWPMLRLPVASARLVAVHGEWFADRLRRDYPDAAIESIRTGVDDPLPGAAPPEAAGARGRKRLGLAPDEIVFAALGSVAPERRLPQILRALAAVRDAIPSARLVLVGAGTSGYDVMRDAAACGVADRVVRAGYVEDAALGDCLAAADVCLCLRWPSGRRISASWLRCLAAGKPTIVTDLPHLGAIPVLVTRRVWTPSHLAADSAGAPIAVSIDLLDEERSLAIAMRRLAADAGLRRRLGGRARAWWRAHHRIDLVADDYERVLARAAARPAPALPAALLPDGTARTRALLAPFGLSPAGVFGRSTAPARGRGASS